jgi:hypothetical protein
MNKTRDNIGGYRTIEIISVDRVMGVHLANGFASVTLNTSADAWTELPFQYGTAKIEVTPERTDAGILYNATAEITIPRISLTESISRETERAAVYGAIIRYTTLDGNTYIVGTDDYPLMPVVRQLHPGNATGLSGIHLQLTGKASHPQLIINNE